jgi:hypothetical protein
MVNMNKPQNIEAANEIYEELIIRWNAYEDLVETTVRDYHTTNEMLDDFEDHVAYNSAAECIEEAENLDEVKDCTIHNIKLEAEDAKNDCLDFIAQIKALVDDEDILAEIDTNNIFDYFDED